MKTILLFLTLTFSCLAADLPSFAAPAGFLTVADNSYVQLVTLDSSGVFRFAAPPRLVSMTQTSMVFEVTYTPRVFVSCAVDHGGQPCPDSLTNKDTKARIHFKVEAGKLVFGSIEFAKFVEPLPGRWEWPEARESK